MTHDFDAGYDREPFRTLVSEYPDESVYSPKDFRVEWGPIFHRGRLDGSARVLIIGQDPAARETVLRRILVGAAGQRVQGFLHKLGIETSYVMINVFLYSVYGQGGGERHKKDPGIIDYRNRWLDALLIGSRVQAVVGFGGLADLAWKQWKETSDGSAWEVAFTEAMHPTYPEGSSKGDREKLAEATRKLLANWNEALESLAPRISEPDVVHPLKPYGTEFQPEDYREIPEIDVPAGLPSWMSHETATWFLPSTRSTRGTI